MREWFIIALAFILPSAGLADTIRVATYNASLTRSGAGLLLRAIEKGEDKQIAAVIDIIQIVRPDILLINEFDHDVDELAAKAFKDALEGAGAPISYPHFYTSVPNTGYLSGVDMNGDGKTRGPDDAFGYGKFPGQYGMLLLSRYPIDADEAHSFTKFLWLDFPDAKMPLHGDGEPFPTKDAQEVMRLSSKSHWDVPIETPNGRLNVFASHPTPPVFDGPEDRNGLRNADEIRFWVKYLDGFSFPDDQGRVTSNDAEHFVVLGDLNADPFDGDGRHESIKTLIDHEALQDPLPQSAGGEEAAGQGGANETHQGDPALDTADWNDARGPGNLRVDYVLPSKTLKVMGSGVFWPDQGDPLFRLIGSGKPVSSDHRLVWVDLEF